MKTRILVIAAIVAMLAAIWLASSRSPQSSGIEGGALAPGLEARLDQVSLVRITGAGNAVLATLQRDGDGQWRMPEKADYPVDVEKLRKLLQAIALAQKVEPKTALPERHAQLGVEDVAAADARGVQVDIEGAGDAIAIVFGDNVARGTGTYVRLANDAQSWLVGNNIAVERNPANWLVKELIDIGANRIEAIRVQPVEGPVIELVRNTEDDAASDFAFVDLPRGREPAEGYTREALAGVLSGLTFEDVFTLKEMPEPEAVQQTRFRLRDGRQLELRSWQQDQRTYARLSMTLDEEVAKAWIQAQPALAADEADEANADADGADEGGAESRDMPVETLESLAAQVAAFEQAHQDRVYVLPMYKASNLNKGLEDYLKPRE